MAKTVYLLAYYYYRNLPHNMGIYATLELAQKKAIERAVENDLTLDYIGWQSELIKTPHSTNDNVVALVNTNEGAFGISAYEVEE
jgi:hypothetical protein